MAISAEELNIILSAKDREFNKKINAANKRVRNFAYQSRKNLNQTTKAMDKLSISAGKLGGVLSIGAISIGFKRLIDNATQTSKDLTNLSTLAGVNVERFQEMSFAAANFGVSQEKLADILKDTNDKFVGMVTLGIDASVSGKQFVPATANNEVNLNGEAGAAVATTGGLKGSYIKFTAVAANLYFVEGLLNSTGSIATPFDTQ